jgi:two-component system response regulator YesN
MIKLLIVDDEELIREGLALTIDWARIGIEVEGTAEDGAEALALLEHTPCDILLTDIRMPGMDGLELIRKVKEISPHIICVILTGHGEFSYAQQALKLGAYDLILKPTREEELLEVMERAVATIRQTQQETELRTRLLLEKFVQDEEPVLLNEIQHLFPYSPGYAILVVSTRLKEESRLKDEDYFLLQQKDKQFTLLAYNVGEKEELEKRSMALDRQFRTAGEPVGVSVSHIVTALSELPKAYQQAVLVHEQQQQGTEPGIRYYSAYDQLPMHEVVTYIEQHLNRSITLNELADKYAVSSSYFSRMFKLHTGANFVTYVTTKKLNKAKLLLEETNLRLAEIATHIGYPEPRYLSQLFKKYEGMTPSEYRQMKREES